MSAYLIYQYNILDRSRVDELGPLSIPILEKYGGEIAIGDYVLTLEGSPYSHIVAYKFESLEAAKRFYESVEHQELSKLRREVIEGTVILVPEFGHNHGRSE